MLGLAVAALLFGRGSGQAAETLLDAVLAGVNGAVVTAGDVAIARSLSLFGARPSDGPIRKADAEQLVDGRLIAQEAAQLAIGGDPQEAEAAWQAAAERVGGMPALRAWMDQAGLAEAGVKPMVEMDLRWRRFIDFRFRAFAFVTDADVAEALGPGAHPPDVLETARERLRAEATGRAVAAWLTEARKRASIRFAEIPAGGVPPPFPTPPAAPRNTQSPARPPATTLAPPDPGSRAPRR